MTPMAKQLLDAQKSGVYQLVRSPDEVAQAAGDAGLAVFRIDLGQASDKKSFLLKTAEALQFPNWFGVNWDALNDCLTDLGWLKAQAGYVLIFEKGDYFCSGRNQEFEDARDVLRNAAEHWKGEAKPFWVLIEVSPKSDRDLPKWPM